jgi:hypothetical protein
MLGVAQGLPARPNRPRYFHDPEPIDPEQVLRRLARLVPASVERFARSVGVALALLDNRRP